MTTQIESQRWRELHHRRNDYTDTREMSPQGLTIVVGPEGSERTFTLVGPDGVMVALLTVKTAGTIHSGTLDDRIIASTAVSSHHNILDVATLPLPIQLRPTARDYHHEWTWPDNASFERDRLNPQVRELLEVLGALPGDTAVFVPPHRLTDLAPEEPNSPDDDGFEEDTWLPIRPHRAYIKARLVPSAITPKLPTLD